jgi:hypothetical protein
MVRELLPHVSDRGSPDADLEAAPAMFTRPSDVPDPLPSVQHGAAVTRLHSKWIHLTPTPADPTASRWNRLVSGARRVARREAGSIDAHLIADLIRAIDAVAARCDEISRRLEHQQVVADEMATIFGEELTRLRAQTAARDGGDEGSTPPPLPRHE